MTVNYTISTDTLNGAVDVGKLSEQIQDSSITIALNSITTSGDTLSVTFKANLSSSEQTTLDGLVSSHDGSSSEPEPEVVQLSYTTPLGIPEIAVTKPDGSSRTYISHNFCDSSTWPAVDDSAWCLDSVIEGSAMKVYRAEVQFTHDVELSTKSPTSAQMNLDVMAGGVAVPSESKQFATLYDVFDLGNKHYTMNATVDGIPGITTVQFDYTDAIVLDPSLLMAMKFYMKDNVPMGGTHCSVALVAGAI